VVPQVDTEFGCRPVSFLKFRPGCSASCADIIDYLQKHLPGFKIPIRLLHWPEIDDIKEMQPDRLRFRKLVEAEDVVEIS
jgi:hypothetical protein